MGGADLRTARFCDARLKDALLANALLDGIEAYRTDFSGATLTATSFTEARLSGANFKDVKILDSDDGRPVRRPDFLCATLGATTPEEYCGARDRKAEIPGANVPDQVLARLSLCRTILPNGTQSNRDCPDPKNPPSCHRDKQKT
jgi:uncharacterized protein YjbI with pentapeptide repeats